jgi:hypothetical protein
MKLLLSALVLVQIGESWDVQFTEPFVLDREVATIVLDLDNHDAETFAKVKTGGTRLLCYVSVGTREDWRRDAGAFPDAVVGKALPDWPGESYLDLRRLDVLLPIMTERFRACREAGFDGIEADNLDAFENDSGFDLSASDAVAYLTALAAVAHGMDLLIGQKNAPELAPALVGTMDFAVAESCWQYGFCEAFSAYTEADKPVFALEYLEAGFDAACAEATKQGISMILKDHDLTGGVYRSCQ